MFREEAITTLSDLLKYKRHLLPEKIREATAFAIADMRRNQSALNQIVQQPIPSELAAST